MLAELDVKDFTAFGHAKFEFAQGLNVFVGENGTGKTHVLKLGYACLQVMTKSSHREYQRVPEMSHYEREIARKLVAVFKPDSLGRLTRRNRPGRASSKIGCQLVGGNQIEYTFSTNSKSEVSMNCLPNAQLEKRPVYLPTRELLTIYPGFVSLYETTHLPFDETWRDTCILLGAPLARGPRERQIKVLLGPLEQALGGKVNLTDAGGFYLNIDNASMEMHLVAEGLRKLAMLARLIATGSLTEKGYLFWDEPEANLNPKMIKIVARTILHLCQSGIQVFVASHSLFLLRELDILLRWDEFSQVPRRFFGLHPGKEGVRVDQGESIDEIGEIASLQEELSQSDRYLDSEAQ